MVLGTSFVSAQTPPINEYQVKAAFLFNFTQFMEWPKTSFPNDQSPFVIGIFGDDPFGAYLNEIVPGVFTLIESIMLKDGAEEGYDVDEAEIAAELAEIKRNAAVTQSNSLHKPPLSYEVVIDEIPTLVHQQLPEQKREVNEWANKDSRSVNDN